MAHRRRLALRFWQRAAEQGNAEASRKVGDYYYYGWVGTNINNDAAASDPTPRATASAPSPIGDTSTATSSAVSASTSTSASAPPPPPAPAPAPAPTTLLLPDYEAAADAYLLAAENRDAQAMFNMGFMYQRGLGVPRDLHLAKRYYDMTLTSAPDSYVPVRMMLAQVHTFTHFPSRTMHMRASFTLCFSESSSRRLLLSFECCTVSSRQLWLTMRWEESWAPWLIQQQWIDSSWQNTSHIYARTAASWGRIVDLFRWSEDAPAAGASEQVSTDADASSSPPATLVASKGPTTHTAPGAPAPSPTAPGGSMPGGPLPWQNLVLLEITAMTDGLLTCWEDVAIFFVALALAVLIYIRRGT